mgnify:CR=1 FL=1
MTYTFEKKDADTFLLKYKNKEGKQTERTFTKNVKLARTLQRVNALAKIEMMSMLKEQGLTRKDLIVETKNEKGQIIYDESNLNALEQDCLQIVMTDLMDKLMFDEFGINFIELLDDMGLNVKNPTEKDAKDIEIFVTKLGLIITGQDEDPSEQND